MSPEEFNSHNLWLTLDAVVAQIDEWTTTPGSEAELQRVRFLVEYTRSFKALANGSSHLFANATMTPVDAPWQRVHAHLQSVGSPTFATQAVLEAESALVPIGLWPRPVGKGGQVAQMQDLFDRLLVSQAAELDARDSRHESFSAQATDVTTELEAKKTEVLGELANVQTTAAAIRTAVDAEKARIDTVIADGLREVAGLSKSNETAWGEFETTQTSRFEEKFDPFLDSVRDSKIAADQTLAEIREAEKDYVKLLSAVAGGKMAAEFEQNAKNDRKAGWILYAIGGVFIVLSGVPLVFLFIEQIGNEVDAPVTTLLTRLAIGVVAGSAATVAIRLGSRFMANATRSGWMGLELRAFDPFMRNVASTKADAARIDLVGRAFSRPLPAKGEKNEETVPSSLAGQVVELASKLADRLDGK